MAGEVPSRLTPAGRWAVPLGLAALVGMLLLLRLGQDVPVRSHEALLAETARNMFLDTEVQLPDASRPSAYMVPNFNGVPRLRKTPLPYWSVAGLAYLTGEVDAWTARFPGALGAVATVLVLTALVWHWCDRRTALVAGAVLATSVGFVTSARTAMADMPMASLTTISLAALWMGVAREGRRRFRWFVLAGASAGLAMLAKGPAPLLVFPGPCLVAGWVVVSRLRRASRSGESSRAGWAWTVAGAAAAVVVFVAVIVPWPLYVYLRVPSALEIWQAESVDRAAGDYGHKEAFYYYLLRVPLLVGPWTVFFVSGLVMAGRRAWRDPANRAWLAFLGAWLIGPVVAFSLASGKQEHYLLPMLPATAVYTALALRHWLGPAPAAAERTGRRLIIAHGVFFAVLGIGVLTACLVAGAWPAGAGGQALLRELASSGVAWAVAVLAGIATVGAVAATVLAARRRVPAGFAALVVTVAAGFLWAWPTIIGPTSHAHVEAAFGREVQRQVPAEEPVFSFGDVNASVIFHAGRPLPLLATHDEVRDEMRRGRSFYLVAPKERAAPLRDLPGLVVRYEQKNPYRPARDLLLMHVSVGARTPPESG